jgi:hypothetical protein
MIKFLNQLSPICHLLYKKIVFKILMLKNKKEHLKEDNSIRKSVISISIFKIKIIKIKLYKIIIRNSS